MSRSTSRNSLSVGDRYEGSHLAFEQDFQSGAGRFVGGEGRHGAF